MEWSEFAQRLGRELASLERDTILIVRERDESRHYVQAMREPDRLYAEAVSNNFLEGPLLLTLADEEVMSDAGWRPPVEPAPRNWWTELPQTGSGEGMRAVTAADHARLAEVMVTALRDVQGVRRPSDLVYESFHRHGTGLIELIDFGIDTADPARVGKRRSSVAEAAAAEGPPTEGLPPSVNVPEPRQELPGPPEVDLLEPRLAEAKQRGDHTTYFELLLDADLVIPADERAAESPDGSDLPTITIGSATYATVFTSPGALARAGGRQPGPFRRTSFALLATGWPDPAWQLAINAGLPSEIHLDAAAIARLDASQRAAAADPDPPTGIDPKDPFGHGTPMPYTALDPPGRSENGSHAAPAEIRGMPADSHTAIDPFTVAELNAAIESGSVPAAPMAAPTVDAPAPPGPVPMRPPHGTRLWYLATEGGPPAPVAVYDAIGGVWAPARADAVPAPGSE